MASLSLYAAILLQLVVAILLFFLLPISPASATVDKDRKIVVATSHGMVTGQRDISYSSRRPFTRFFDLPYAEAPIGSLRFARPRRYSGFWDGIKNATTEEKICLQKSIRVPPLLEKKETEIIGQEDCLVVSVSVPDSCLPPRTKCPVMAWLSSPSFKPHLWMDYDVVMVTVSHRLGVLGFLSLDSEFVPGNMGLWDQQMALEWISSEVSSFGGDPASVTLVGPGVAGGHSALLQMLSPSNIGRSLFQRVIIQSGSPVQDRLLWFSKTRRSYALGLAKSLGCNTDDEDEKIIHCLRLQDPVQLQLSAALFSEGSTSLLLPNPFVPTVDSAYSANPFLTDKPERVIQSGMFEQVPVLIGSNANEGLLLMADFITHPSAFANFTQSLPLLLFNKPSKAVTREDLKLIEVIKKVYLRKGDNWHRLPIHPGIRMFTDLVFQGKIGRTVQLLSEHSSQFVYHYLYKYSATHSFGDLVVYAPWKLKIKLLLHYLGLGYNMRNGYGVCHGDELLLMFRIDLPAPMGSGPMSDRDRLASEMLLRAWSTFARLGRPTSTIDESGFVWEPSKGPEYKFNTITSTFRMTTDEDYWRSVDFFSKVMNELDDGRVAAVAAHSSENGSAPPSGEETDNANSSSRIDL